MLRYLVISALSSRISRFSACSVTFLTRVANLSVDLLSSLAVMDGFMVQMTATRASPDKDGWRSWVSLLSR